MSGLSEASASVATATDDVGSSLDEASTAAADLDTSVLSVDDSMSALAEALSSTDAASADAATSLEDAGSAIDDAGSVSDDTAASMEALADSLADAGNGAEAASSGLGNLNPELEESGEAGEEAGDSFKEMAEQLVQFGEALAITEALKEFGEEALEVAGDIEQATVSLTALDNSAEQATETLEGLKTVATSDALSFPSLVTAQERMQLLRISLQQIPGWMNTIATAAALSGKSFDTLTQKMDNMVASGNASARSLSQIGINATTLAAAINTTTGQDTANIDNIAAAFKSLTQSQRLDVLQAAFQQYSGVVQQSAQTITGQLTILKTNWEFVMEAIGAAIAPVVTAILEFANNVVLPAIQAMVEGFNQLPTPIKDVVVVLGLLVAAAAPLAVALGGFGLAMSAAKVAVAGLSTAVGALDVVLTPILTIFIAIAGAAVTAYAAWSTFNNIIKDGTTVLQQLGIIARPAAAGTEAVGQAAEGATPPVEAHGVAATAAAAAHTALAAATGQSSTGMAAAGQSAKPSTVALQSMGAAVTAVQSAYRDVVTEQQNALTQLGVLPGMIAAGVASWTQYSTALETGHKGQRTSEQRLPIDGPGSRSGRSWIRQCEDRGSQREHHLSTNRSGCDQRRGVDDAVHHGSECAQQSSAGSQWRFYPVLDSSAAGGE